MKEEDVIAIVEKKDINDMLSIIENMSYTSPSINKFIRWTKEQGKNGIIIRY